MPRPYGLLICVSGPMPPSPEKPAVPVPAIVTVVWATRAVAVRARRRSCSTALLFKGVRKRGDNRRLREAKSLVSDFLSSRSGPQFAFQRVRVDDPHIRYTVCH